MIQAMEVIDVEAALASAIIRARACAVPGDWAMIAMALHQTNRTATLHPDGAVEITQIR